MRYAPLGRGFLTAHIIHPNHLGDGDLRAAHPRFTGDAFATNMGIVRALQDLADVEGMSVAQLALAWVQSRGQDVVPIPGTRHAGRLAENVAAATIELTDDALARIEALAPAAAFIGTRYPEDALPGLGI